MEKPFRYNNRYVASRATAKWFVGGEVAFSQKQEPWYADGFYRTIFGPAVAVNSVTYCACDPCFALAFRRQTACREPEAEGPVRNPKYGNVAEEELRENQAQFFASAGWVEVVGRLREMYNNHIDLKVQEEEMKEHAGDPHQKVRLRMQAKKELLDTCSVADDLWILDVLVKMKREEHAKDGKYPRTIGDLGVAASLQGFRLTEMLKSAQSSEELHYMGGRIIFIKSPQPEVLREAFEELVNPTGTFAYVYFSDDACLAHHRPDGVRICNMDISSCDTSHGPSVFQTLIDLMPLGAREQMEKLVRQCSLPVRIQSLASKTERLKLLSREPTLYSGSTITTAINNVANVAIAVACAQDGFRDVVASARRVGYIVTVEEAEQPEDIQFLKCSPVYDVRGRLQPVLNLGVLLRLSGACKGDLPGRGDWRPRASAFQASLLRGYMPGMENAMIDSMRSRFYPYTNPSYDAPAASLYEHKMKGDTPFRVDNANLTRRYKLDPVEEAEVNRFFSGATIGTTSGGTGLSKILMKDYSQQCNDALRSARPVHPTEPRT